MKNAIKSEQFVDRHIGVESSHLNEMLQTLGVSSIDELIDRTIPARIRLDERLDIGEVLSEFELLNHLRNLASKNKLFKTYIGQGYYDTITPSVIKRNILENPGWYTQYTPYQAEISQGRLEALINFQTMVSDLTGMEIANASLLDEATAAAEAMIFLHSLRPREKKSANKFFVSEKVFPQTIDVLKTRANPIGIEIVIGEISEENLSEDVFGILVQYPAGYGELIDYTDFFGKAASKGILRAVAADLLALTLIKPPSEFGADVVVGSTQRFGVPMGYGGPHAAYFATKSEYKRQIPGRIIGASIDRHGKKAYRMALQTREQHIRREKATSNICTAQVLLAIMAGMYAVYHGPAGLEEIAVRINTLASYLHSGIRELGLRVLSDTFFDTVSVDLGTGERLEKLRSEALKRKINLRYIDDTKFGISIGETVTADDIKELLELLSAVSDASLAEILDKASNAKAVNIPDELKRQTGYMTHEVFHSYRSETEMMRYIKSLERKDLSLTNSMIPLGSCTMKLNAASEMESITYPGFSQLHPFVPSEQAEGYSIVFSELEDQLSKITGFSAVSLQPNSGAQGEYAGLMVIRAYHMSMGNSRRDVVLIPSSAHGTNPASAVMAGGRVVIVNCDSNGNIDLDDLRAKAELHKDRLSALMVTYPSTHGVFEEEIQEICRIVHDFGGQVYMDGANLNAQLGLTSPAKIGADVCHLNLHKTFTIPHGGGGPGMGPIAVADHLKSFLPGHSVVDIGGEQSISAVSAAPWGSANILLISYAYNKMMGGAGLTEATKYAILNANYIARKLNPFYKVLYSGKNGFVGHELIFDLREFKYSANIEVEDIAKRLMDYGYHAPTVSFPVPGTIMVEPTESESKRELDRFCDAMMEIRREISEIIDGKADKIDNVLKNSPHTAEDVISDGWSRPYSREKAAYPLPWVRNNKFWPSVGRIDSAYGDRNLVCTCAPVSEYESETV